MSSTLEIRMWNYISACVWDLHVHISYLILLLLYNSSSLDYTQFVYSHALVKCFNYSQSLAPANKGPVHTEPCRSLILGVTLVSLATCLRRNKAMGQSILDFRGTLALYPRRPYARVPVALCCIFPNVCGHKWLSLPFWRAWDGVLWQLWASSTFSHESFFTEMWSPAPFEIRYEGCHAVRCFSVVSGYAYTRAELTGNRRFPPTGLSAAQTLPPFLGFLHSQGTLVHLLLSIASRVPVSGPRKVGCRASFVAWLLQPMPSPW